MGYVDDTTFAEVVPTSSQSVIQNAVTAVEQWSTNSRLQLSPDKCKELLVDFKRPKHQFDEITVNSKELELVNHAKVVLGVTISSTLQWNCHISDVIKKANMQCFSLFCLIAPRSWPVILSVSIIPALDRY